MARRPLPDPVQEDLRGLLNATAEGLDKVFNGPMAGPKGLVPRKVGFFLTVFPLVNAGERHPDARFNYISNCDKLDVLTMLKDVVARIEHRASRLGGEG